MNYYDKYLKYKIKYNNLLNLQTGNGYFHEKNEQDKKLNPSHNKNYAFIPCTLKANLNKSNLLYLYITENCKSINLGENTNLQYDFHISLLQFEINMSHRLNVGNNKGIHIKTNNFGYRIKDEGKFISDKFKNFIIGLNLRSKFLEIFNKVKITTGEYDFLGEKKEADGSVHKRFITQSLKIDNNHQVAITQFRTFFYEELNPSPRITIYTFLFLFLFIFSFENNK